MPGWLGWQPNRKSRIGLRHLSRLPRTHRYPPWSTTPPIAEEEPMQQQDTQQQQQQDAVRVEETRTGARRVLRGLVLCATDPSEDPQSKVAAMLEALDDVRLVQLATEALTNVKRVKASYDEIETSLKRMRQELESVRGTIQAAERAVADAEKARKERDDIAAKYADLKKQLDPEKQQLEIMYAIDEATKSTKAESVELRRELAQRQAEVDNLRASKKRLRDALDRLAGKD